MNDPKAQSHQNLANGPEIPMGLGMALAQNPFAMAHFATLPEERRRQIIAMTHQVTSSGEMSQLVRSMMDGSIGPPLL